MNICRAARNVLLHPSEEKHDIKQKTERNRKVIYSLSSHRLRNYWEEAICKHMKEDWRRPQPSVCRTRESSGTQPTPDTQQNESAAEKKPEAVQELWRESSDTDRERQRSGGQGRFAWGGSVALLCRCLSRSLTQDFDEAVPALISNPNSTLGLWFTLSLFTLTTPPASTLFTTQWATAGVSPCHLCVTLCMCVRFQAALSCRSSFANCQLVVQSSRSKHGDYYLNYVSFLN